MEMRLAGAISNATVKFMAKAWSFRCVLPCRSVVVGAALRKSSKYLPVFWVSSLPPPFGSHFLFSSYFQLKTINSSCITQQALNISRARCRQRRVGNKRQPLAERWIYRRRSNRALTEEGRGVRSNAEANKGAANSKKKYIRTLACNASATTAFCSSCPAAKLPSSRCATPLPSPNV